MHQIDMFNGYEWQGYKLEVSEGRQIDKFANVTGQSTTVEREHVPPLNHRPPAEIIFKSEPGVSNYPPAVTPPVSAIPTPASTVDPASYQSMYRYGAETATPAPPHLPPPPPMYTHLTLVGGPAANLPTHGHNQIFVNNVRIDKQKSRADANRKRFVAAILYNMAGFNRFISTCGSCCTVRNIDNEWTSKGIRVC